MLENIKLYECFDSINIFETMDNEYIVGKKFSNDKNEKFKNELKYYKIISKIDDLKNYVVDYLGNKFLHNTRYIFLKKENYDLSKYVEKIEVTENILDMIIFDLIKGLKLLHKNGIKHRDIKAQNILVSLDNNNNYNMCKYCDFEYSTTKIYSNKCYGTPYNTSPEELSIDEKNEINLVKSDIYSLGCTIYQTIYKKFPYSDIKEMQQLIYEKQNYMPYFKNDNKYSELMKYIMTINPLIRPYMENIEIFYEKNILKKN